MRDFDWQILVTLHKTHNISRTAELLYVSQPTLTKRIQLIEEELGIPILVRSRKGSVFTPEGDRLAQKAEIIAAAIQDVKNDVARHKDGQRGFLKLGAPYSYVRYVLPTLLAKFALLYPDIDVDIVSGLSNELAQRVEDESIDVCFARYNASDSHLERIKVSEDQVYVVSSRPFELKDLSDMRYIDFNKNHVVISKIQRWWNENFTSPLVAHYRVPTGDCCAQMVKHGVGFGIFPDPRYFNQVKGLYSVPMQYQDGTMLTRQTWMLYESKKRSNPALDKFIRFVETIDIDSLNIESEEFSE